MKRSHSMMRTCVVTTAASLSFTLAPALAQTTLVDLKSQAKGVDFSRAPATRPFKTGTSLPLTCNVGESYFKTDAASGQNLYGCTAMNSWALESGGGLPTFSGNSDHLLGTDGMRASWVALGGDVTGSPASLTVNKLQGRGVASTTPTDGQVLRWNSTSLNWEPGTLAVSSSGSSNSNTGGDLFGLLTNATVTRLQNRPMSAAAPADGQVLTWSQTGSQWQPQSPAAGSGSSGSAPSGATPGVLGVSFSSANTITIGAGCSLASPCNIRFGTNVLAIITSATVTWQSGAGLAYIYVTSAGTVTVGSNLTVNCSSGCFAGSGVTGFPVNSVPLFTWSANATGWDATGGRDLRAYLASKILSAGAGVVLVESGQQSTIGIDTTSIPTYLTGTATQSFGTLAANSCSQDIAMNVPGAIAGDALAPGWPAVLPGSVLGTMRVTAPNTVSLRLCNLGSAPAAVAPASYRATVVRGL